MVIQTPQFQHALPVAFGNQPTANAERFGLGLVMVEPPAVSLSLGHQLPPRLPIPDAKPGRKDDGESAKRYPSFSAPVGPVGRFHCFPACQTVRTDGLTPSARTPAATATLESKLDPFGRRRDCQSLPGQTDLRNDSKVNASWPSDAVTALTAAPK